LFRGVLGILIGVGLYSEVYPFIQDNLLKLGDYGKLTLATAFGVNPWIVIVPVATVMGGVLMWLEKHSE
jgi:hypothetical protein